MKTILLFMPYYGKLPAYFDLWLEAARRNSSVDFCLLTDLVEDTHKLPGNVKLLPLTLEAFERRIQESFAFPVSMKSLGRISQFRPALAYVFPEVVEGYEYWGFIECDLIFGDIRHFLTDSVLENHEKVFKLGHFQVFKNNEKMRCLFMREHRSALSYRFAFRKNVLYFEELLGIHNIARAEGVATYVENVFSDIRASELYFTRSQYAYPHVPAGLHCVFAYRDGRLYEYSYDGKELKKREVLYAHFQKRRMSVRVRSRENYIIIPNRFTDTREIDIALMESIDKHLSKYAARYRQRKEAEFAKARKERYRQICWWQLAVLRFRIRKNGGVDLDGV